MSAPCRRGRPLSSGARPPRVSPFAAIPRRGTRSQTIIISQMASTPPWMGLLGRTSIGARRSGSASSPSSCVMVRWNVDIHVRYCGYCRRTVAEMATRPAASPKSPRERSIASAVRPPRCRAPVVLFRICSSLVDASAAALPALLRSPRRRRSRGRSSAPATSRLAIRRSTDAGPTTTGGPPAAERAAAACWAIAARAGRDVALSANSRITDACAALSRAVLRRATLDADKRAIAPCVRPARTTSFELGFSVAPVPPGRCAE